MFLLPTRFSLQLFSHKALYRLAPKYAFYLLFDYILPKTQCFRLVKVFMHVHKHTRWCLMTQTYSFYLENSSYFTFLVNCVSPTRLSSKLLLLDAFPDFPRQNGSLSTVHVYVFSHGLCYNLCICMSAFLCTVLLLEGTVIHIYTHVICICVSDIQYNWYSIEYNRYSIYEYWLNGKFYMDD